MQTRTLLIGALFLAGVFSNLKANIIGKKSQPVTLEKAIKAGWVSVKIKGKGGHQGKCIQMKMKNTQPDSIYVIVEAGRKLDSEDPSVQDIFVVQEQQFALSKGQTKTQEITGYCCQASNHSPSDTSKFKVGKMADSTMIKLAQFLKNKKYGMSDVQNAVWCLSDDHDLSSIPQGNRELREFISKLKGIEVPWYQKEFSSAEEGRVFSNQASKISGNIDYRINNTSQISIQLRNKNGLVIQNFTHEKFMEKGSYNYWFELTVTNWPKGEYFIYIFADSQQIMKREFSI